jgi:hypothetical protein
MILAQYNILGFYTSLDARQWNRAMTQGLDYETYRVFLETNNLPAIQLVVDASLGATIQLMDINDGEVGSSISMTVEDGGHPTVTYKKLIFNGDELVGMTDGDYYLKIINGSDIYYSDVFAWTSDSDYLSELMKISVESSNIKLGRYYTLNLIDFVFECYLNAEYLGINPEFEEELTQRNGINKIIYGSLVPTREFNIYGCEYIYKFLLGLRILESNGSVTITYNSVNYSATDTMAEKLEDHFSDLMQIKLSFVDENEVLTVSNETND